MQYFLKPFALVVLFLLTLAGCSSYGPKTVPDDQFNYNAAIAQSTQEQLLLNLVRLRYNETPVFLKVSSVISQYSRVASANASAAANSSVTGDNTAGIGGRVAWADRPTISYVPLSGQEFSRNLLTPIPPGSVFSMIQSGWPASLVVPLTVWSINSIENEIARPESRRQADPELIDLLQVWNRLRQAGVLGISKQNSESGNSLVLFLREGQFSSGVEDDIEDFASLLDVDLQQREFPIRYGLVSRNRNDVTVLTGSIWEIMLGMAWQFEVPPEHIQSGRTGVSFQSDREDGVAPIELRYSQEEPENAFVSIHEHGYWFYIDNNDGDSKGAFSFLQLLLNLSETSTEDSVPVFTISN